MMIPIFSATMRDITSRDSTSRDISTRSGIWCHRNTISSGRRSTTIAIIRRLPILGILLSIINLSSSCRVADGRRRRRKRSRGSNTRCRFLLISRAYWNQLGGSIGINSIRILIVHNY